MEMKAGRGLDALVAEKVMGWTPIPDAPSWSEGYRDANGIPQKTRPFSTSIADAWSVVEKLRANGFEYGVRSIDAFNHHVVFSRKREAFGEFAISDTAPHAICLAALQAVGFAG